MLSIVLAALMQATATTAPPGEEPVAPYAHSDANAGAASFAGTHMWRAFHEQPGIDRVVDRFVDLNTHDPRIADIFKAQDLVRLRRTLKEQFCYILGGGCTYTGRDMRAGHKDLGIQMKDMNAVVDNLQRAMSAEHVAFAAQNRFLAKLAPMKRVVVER